MCDSQTCPRSLGCVRLYPQRTISSGVALGENGHEHWRKIRFVSDNNDNDNKTHKSLCPRVSFVQSGRRSEVREGHARGSHSRQSLRTEWITKAKTNIRQRNAQLQIS